MQKIFEDGNQRNKKFLIQSWNGNTNLMLRFSLSPVVCTYYKLYKKKTYTYENISIEKTFCNTDPIFGLGVSSLCTIVFKEFR